MKKIILCTACALILASGACPQDRTRETSTDSTIIAALAQVSSDSLLSYVASLQDFGTRFMMSPNRKQVATHIMEQFAAAGLTEVRLDSFLCYTHVNAPPYVVFDTTTWQYNVEAKITGSTFPACELLMMAHYDDFANGIDPMETAPGADDNASGVAALLECARVLSETGYQPSKTMVFLATAAEELMYVSESGAMHYAQEAAADGRNLSMILNNDMISWNDSTWSIRLINDTNSQIPTDLTLQVLNAYTTLDWYFEWSGTFADLTFFLDEGYQGIYFMESTQNGFYPYYHTVEDLTDQIDTAYLKEITRLNLGCFLLSDLLKNDAVLTGITHVPEATCSEQISPVITILNNGADPLTAIDIVCTVNEESPVIIPWTGSLAFGETAQVELQALPFGLLPENTLEISLDNVNGKADELEVNNTRLVSFVPADATPEEIKLKIRLDAFPEQTTWDFKNIDGEIVFSGGPYSTPNAFVDETLVFDIPGCHTFSVYDAGGDGIQYGFVLLYTGTNDVILQILGFESIVQTQFDVGGTLLADETESATGIGFYPNPVHDAGYITIKPGSDAGYAVAVYNLLGQKVLEMPEKIYPGGTIPISFTDRLSRGLYILSVTNENRAMTCKVLKE